MSTPDYVTKARLLTLEVINDERSAKDLTPIELDEVFVVWFCKTLQHWKALTSSRAFGSDYYEITHDGGTGETYIDCYRKIAQIIETPESDLQGRDDS